MHLRYRRGGGSFRILYFLYFLYLLYFLRYRLPRRSNSVMLRSISSRAESEAERMP
jgi:hypothetical protein